MDEETQAAIAAAVESGRARAGCTARTRSASGTATAEPCGRAAASTPIVDVDGQYEGMVSLVTDITEQRAVRGAAPLQRGPSDHALRGLVGHHGDPRARRDVAREPGGHAHPRVPDRLGPRRRDPLAAYTPRTSTRRASRSAEVLAGTRGKHEPVRLRLRHIDGHYLWFDCTAENQIDNPTVRGLIIIARDVTEQKAAEDAQAEAETRFRAAFERSPLGIALITLEGVHHRRERGVHDDGRTDRGGARSASTSSCSSTPTTANGSSRRAPGAVLGEATTPPGPGAPAAARRPGRLGDGRRLVRHQPGRDPRVHDRPGGGRHRAQEAGGATRVPGVPRPAHAPREPGPPPQPPRDGVGAPQRPRVSSRSCSSTSTGSSRSTTPAGTKPATSCCCSSPRRLERSVRAGDAVARFGGDEFVVICEEVASRDEAVQIAGRIRESLARTYRLSSGEANVAASVGHRHRRRPGDPSTTCCATPTWPRTGPRSSAGTGSSSPAATRPAAPRYPSQSAARSSR